MILKKQLIIAHRGASGLVKHENTIEAFEKAYLVGADSVELDIRKTKDNVIVVIHDSNFLGKFIKDYNYNELIERSKNLDFIIPTLEEAINYCQNKIMMDIEIKEEGYEKEILDIILKHLDYEQFFIRSFSVNSLKKIKELDSNVTCVLLLGVPIAKYGIFTRLSELFPLAKILKSKCDIVSPHYLLIHFGFHFRMKLIKKPVLVWTVDDEKRMNKLLNKIKVEGIVTNYPNKALEIKNKNK